METSQAVATSETFAAQSFALTRWGKIASVLQRVPIFPLFILATLVFTAVAADFLAPHNPEVGNLRYRYRPPVWQERGSWEYVLGTDHMGRDILSRLIYGARISLIVGVTASLFAGIVGTTLGILSGFRGGWVDQVIMRVTDSWLALPGVTFAILLAVLIQPSKWNIVIILGLVYWTRYARVIRGEVLSLKERDYVRLATVAGCSRAKIMWTHILPNVANSAIVIATLQVGVSIIAEATLSFLGVGVAPPEPAWGLMLAEGKSGLMAGYWWLSVLPGLCIMLVVLAANLLGDWFRVWSDPQLRQL
ncbi:MAG TPA: ABC transporter permease [Candidatus Tectomicrobia bacterium]|nr:ABC transporter permease [Candidatus Tectomicrobia bacterium]